LMGDPSAHHTDASTPVTAQSVVPANAWQTTTLVPSPDASGESVPWVLFTCVVSPAFEYPDLVTATEGELGEMLPNLTL
ncbi:hypothetical protein KIPB_011661, partial [Kipferlia bialata]